MLQFPHVARPGMGEQGVDGRGREARHRSSRPAGRRSQEVCREQRHVGRPLAERRHLDGHHVDPPVQIGPKPARRHQVGKVFVGGQDHAGVDRMRSRSADRLELHVLQHAEELHLHGWRRRGDLVEEDRAAVGLKELAVAVAGGAGEGAGNVAEELAFEQ